MVEDVLILSIKPPQSARFVGARFAHEGWNVLHAYSVNENGVFVLDFPVPEGVRDIRYRIVIDGLWTTDPSNPVVETNPAGSEFSVFTLQAEPDRPVTSPRRNAGGALTFLFRGTPGRRVALVGDFNNWDPFMDLMEETSPGTFTLSIRVPPGPHFYFFVTEGRRVLDGFNTETGRDPDGGIVSYFSFPS
jgi:1,4-alpha-glucan branching enzyme